MNRDEIRKLPAKTLEKFINEAWFEKDKLKVEELREKYSGFIDEVLDRLETNALCVVEKDGEDWKTHTWIKKAILLYFVVREKKLIPGLPANYYDKVPVRFKHPDEEAFQQVGARVVPTAIVRRGAFIGKNSILMPSYTNIGAHVGANTLVDTWATVGSCAYIGENVHLSGGAGIGGVLEPLQATPTIIEDNCFIGARSEIVEGVRIGTGSVISMGVFIGQSTKIYDRTTGEISYGYVPPWSVVVPGSLPSEDGKYNLNCAIIVKRVDENTRFKTSLNDLLRDELDG
jgi:2,3,4,5-tetrahydropyridine-2-carboxylate N-succinyltransferase